MSDVSMRDMLEAGVHFGHQTRYWNPKMASYLFGHRNKIHIIDLEKTLPLFKEAMNFVSGVAAGQGKILFVGTKRAARQIVMEEAQRCGMPYVSLRWLGGLLTNYKTVKQSIKRLRDLEEKKAEGGTEHMSKKEMLHFERELEKLERNLAGIKDMENWPKALFIIDVGYEDIAVSEAVKLNIPIVGVVDSNSDPTNIDYVIPGNDDAIRSIKLYAQAVADAVIVGRESVAHLGQEGAEDDFVELDAQGKPVVGDGKKPDRDGKKATKRKPRKGAAADKPKKPVVKKAAKKAPAKDADKDAAADAEPVAEQKADAPVADAESSAKDAGKDAPAAVAEAAKDADKDAPAADAEPATEQKADAPVVDAESSAKDAAEDAPVADAEAAAKDAGKDVPAADAEPAAEQKADAPAADAEPAAEQKAGA